MLASNQVAYFMLLIKTRASAFLLTCAEVSAFPPSRSERTHRQEHFSLQAVNNTPIAMYDTRSLNLGLRCTFCWVFILADVKQPILGADFLRNFGLLVDVRHNRLSDAHTQLRVQGIVSQDPSPRPTLSPKTNTKLSSQSFQRSHTCAPATNQ